MQGGHRSLSYKSERCVSQNTICKRHSNDILLFAFSWFLMNMLFINHHLFCFNSNSFFILGIKLNIKSLSRRSTVADTVISFHYLIKSDFPRYISNYHRLRNVEAKNQNIHWSHNFQCLCCVFLIIKFYYKKRSFEWTVHYFVYLYLTITKAVVSRKLVLNFLKFVRPLYQVCSGMFGISY